MALRVYEIFRSIQGEGHRMGIPTTFIRLEGCNLRCIWCDTKYAFAGGFEMELEKILDEVEKFNTVEICITGGEPLIQDIEPLVSELLMRKHRILIETNGSLPIAGLQRDGVIVSMDWKAPSSGETDRMLTENIILLRPIDQLKIVVADSDDLYHVRLLLKSYDIRSPVIVQPMGGTDLHWLAIEVLRSNMDVRVLPQLHKIIWGDLRGV